jgi:hypothetical protein
VLLIEDKRYKNTCLSEGVRGHVIDRERDYPTEIVLIGTKRKSSNGVFTLIHTEVRNGELCNFFFYAHTNYLA